METAALESRQHPLSHIVYIYQVEDADGNVLRREWDLVPRVYHFDTSKDYIFPDQWRDLPLPYHLYTNAYLTMVHGRTDEHVEALRLPLFRRTITFRVSAPQLQYRSGCRHLWQSPCYRQLEYLPLSSDGICWAT